MPPPTFHKQSLKRGPNDIHLQGFQLHYISVVTVYATLGDEALIHGINESEVRFIITDGSLLGKLSAVIDRLPKVEHIVYLGNVVKKSALLGFSRRIKIHSMREIEEIGESQVNCKLQFYLACNPIIIIIHSVLKYKVHIITSLQITVQFCNIKFQISLFS